MSGLLRQISWTAVCVLLLDSAAGADDAIQITPEKGVLLLRNGGVLSGTITKSGDRYYVSLATGEIRVKADDVEMACRSLDEGYRRKRSAIAPGNADQHVDLARWCLKQELFGHAAYELAEALSAEPRHPGIQVLRRRLELALRKPPEHAHHVGLSEPVVSQADLDTMTHDMPAAAVESFTQSVQPLLLNKCATAGCHGPHSATGLKMLRIPPGRTASRRLTQRNLHRVVQWIDRENPSASPLVTVPTLPHGKSEIPIFTSRDAGQVRKLVAWVHQVVRGDMRASQPQSVVRQSEALLQHIPTTDHPRPNETTPRHSVHADGPSPAGYTPVDPFDPEIFNRRFFPRNSDG